ncbi:response regulator transcription factor [Paenibacillus sp. GCM10023252]|uniref:response regulator transcription factor n=1 Tax=Paenibacillus sp. GCM10023252 TaxID=3252649 RepID=UPI00360B0487
MARILVVDDDPHIRELIRVFLAKQSLEVIEAEDGVHAMQLMEKIKPDLAVIDIMMPQKDGWELCEEIRSMYDLPILMLTAQGEIAHKVRGFELGADDYMVKPFDAQELVLRVKALLKRYKVAADQTVQVGKLTLDRTSFEAILNDKRSTLPLKEFELLFKLGSYIGKTFLRDQLIEDIWGIDYEGDERTVDVHIKRVRERYPEAVSGFRIVTIRGLGYRLEECDD